MSARHCTHSLSAGSSRVFRARLATICSDVESCTTPRRPARHGYRVDVDLSSHVVVVELEADATGETAYIIAGPVPMPIKPRGARWTPLFQPCRCRVLARRVLWNWRTLKGTSSKLYMQNERMPAHTACHCVPAWCHFGCTASSSYLLACARSAFEEFNFLYVKVCELPLQPASRGPQPVPPHSTNNC